jgi:hypothetical protein
LSTNPIIELKDGTRIETEYYGSSGGKENYYKAKRPGGGTIEIHFLTKSYFENHPNYSRSQKSESKNNLATINKSDLEIVLDLIAPFEEFKQEIRKWASLGDSKAKTVVRLLKALDS